MPTPQMSGDFDRAQALKQLRSFLGLASYNRRYVQNFAKVVHPLNSLLQKDITLEWTDECQAAWDAVIHDCTHARCVLP